jgi:hypothetical protein
LAGAGFLSLVGKRMQASGRTLRLVNVRGQPLELLSHLPPGIGGDVVSPILCTHRTS